MSLIFNCRGPVVGVYSQELAPKPELIGKPRRAGCGAVLNKLIDLVPADGKDHEVKCPVCKAVSRIKKTPEDKEPA
ncbi:MAG: hypothetical protein OEY11_15055 [Gammaproteobacteria bacterium]|nr:hypothetical protein [Gammaproteobacteria bacterium]